jgi:excisionase family DNA binding protein
MNVPELSSREAEPSLREVLNTDEVAELLGVGRNSVYEAAGRGELPHRRMGKRLLFSRAAVLDWLSCKVPVSTER